MDDDNDLAGAAGEALDEVDEGTEEQPHLPGTDHARVKFTGMAWDTLEVPPLKSEIEVIVRGMVIGHGEEVMTDGEIREVAKVKVTSVTRVGDTDAPKAQGGAEEPF